MFPFLIYFVELISVVLQYITVLIFDDSGRNPTFPKFVIDGLLGLVDFSLLLFCFSIAWHCGLGFAIRRWLSLLSTDLYCSSSLVLTNHVSQSLS